MAHARALKLFVSFSARYKKSYRCPETTHILAFIARALAQTKAYALACVFSFGFVWFFRQSNMIPPSKKAFDATRHFTRDDVWPAQGGLLVKVKWTKTLQRYKEATTVFLPQITGRVLCPVTAFRNMVLRAPTASPSQPLFGHSDGSPLTLGYVNREWKKAIHALGLNLTDFSLHSLRRGVCHLGLGASHAHQYNETWNMGI